VKRIDLDANATTPLLPEVLEAMLPFFAAGGNPSAAHAAGQRARSVVERARGQVAALLGATAKEIVFTSGGTEADNLALRGVMEPWLDRGQRTHMVTTQIEHHAVLFAAEALERRGVAVTYVAPGRDGVVSAEAMVEAMRPETKLVSVMLANNETGVVQPVGRIARMVKAKQPDVLLHTDAVQGAGKVALDVSGEFKNVDLLAISGHKMYAPQGTGALFVRKGVELQPLLHGGPQERQRRAGTENVPGLVGFGRAAELAFSWLAEGGAEKLRELRDEFERELLARVEGARVNGGEAARVVNTVNVMFPGVDAEALLIALDMQGVAASYGAACMSGATEPSHVLLAMGLTPQEAKASVRFSLSRMTTREDVDIAVSVVVAAIQRLKTGR
jgi:cysteine desulfurase